MRSSRHPTSALPRLPRRTHPTVGFAARRLGSLHQRSLITCGSADLHPPGVVPLPIALTGRRGTVGGDVYRRGGTRSCAVDPEHRLVSSLNQLPSQSRTGDNDTMLSATVYRQLSELISQVHQVLDGVNAGAENDEIDLRADAAARTADELKKMISYKAAVPFRGEPFGQLARHLGWLCRYYREEKPDRYASDIRDIRDRDLPGIMTLVERWASSFLDPNLEAAVTESWQAQRYTSVVQDAFIYLERVLRELGGVDPSQGLSGDRLIAKVLGPNGSAREDLASDTFMGQLTGGEIEGLHQLVRGAFLLLRNSAAHRQINYTANEAEDVVHLVNMCLRLLRPEGGATPSPRADAAAQLIGPS